MQGWRLTFIVSAGLGLVTALFAFPGIWEPRLHAVRSPALARSALISYVSHLQALVVPCIHAATLWRAFPPC